MLWQMGIGLKEIWDEDSHVSNRIKGCAIAMTIYENSMFVKCSLVFDVVF
jgi:hypothetical protein